MKTRCLLPAAAVVLVSLLSAAPRARAEVTESEAARFRKEIKEIVQSRRPDRMIAFIDRLVGLDDPKTVGILVEAAIVFPSARNYQTVKGLRRPGHRQHRPPLRRRSGQGERPRFHGPPEEDPGSSEGPQFQP